MTESTKPNLNHSNIQGIFLSDFIEQNTKPIITEWENFAKTLTPAANDMTPLALRDHIPQILAFIVKDIRTPQTSSEQIQKSRGNKEKSSTTSVAETHAALRLSGGFDIDQMVSEWRALRASVIKLWSKANTQMSNIDIIALTRFNESIDQELAESVSHYTEKVSYSKDLFIGILSHELRNPLNVITMAAHLQLKELATREDNKANERQVILSKQITESANRATKIINDLLDVTRARFGSGVPVIKAPMDIGVVSQQLVAETRIAHPTRNVTLETTGNLEGEWDQARIGQVFANLIGNAIQYSLNDSAINIKVNGEPNQVVISVHNMGEPIAPDKIDSIFSSLIRAVTDEGDHPSNVNLGLGLYITKEIIAAHSGTIEATSSLKDGTTITAKIPKAA